MRRNSALAIYFCDFQNFDIQSYTLSQSRRRVTQPKKEFQKRIRGNKGNNMRQIPGRLGIHRELHERESRYEGGNGLKLVHEGDEPCANGELYVGEMLHGELYVDETFHGERKTHQKGALHWESQREPHGEGGLHGPGEGALQGGRELHGEGKQFVERELQGKGESLEKSGLHGEGEVQGDSERVSQGKGELPEERLLCGEAKPHGEWKLLG